MAGSPSPYVRSHAVDLVRWSPWGEEAFQRARELDRPVLLLIGYSTCHWCHVMAEESFADPEVAARINDRFVPVVVDREERPDLDQVYLEAVRRLTGSSGGWPLLVVLTPDREPMAGWTYLPPRDGDRGVRRGLLTVLGELSDQWAGDRSALLARGADLSRELAERSGPPPGLGRPLLELEEEAARRLLAMEDREHGGFGGRPKFPRPVTLDWALARPDTREAALRALVAIDRGSLHDPLAGGFHRYAVDAAWAEPHFEKMTTDNAQLARTLLDAWVATGDPRWEASARSTLGWLASMEQPGGGLASALDADSPGPDGALAEGAFYLWTADQVTDLLGPGGVPVASALGLGARPSAPRRLGEIPPEPLVRMAESRAARPPPAVDPQVVIASQGLAIRALARGGALLRDPSHLALATRLADHALASLGEDGRPRRTAAAGAPPAVLDDPAFLAEGLLELFQATADRRWLDAARDLLEGVDRWYGTPGGGFARTATDAESPLFRPTADQDGSEPAAGAAAAGAMLTLSALTGEEAWRRRAERAWAASSTRASGAPVVHLGWLGVAHRLESPPLELVVVWPDGSEARALPLVDAVLRTEATGAIRLAAPASRALELASAVPLFADRESVEEPTAFVCRAGVCRAPATDPEGARRAAQEALEE